jgi:hypothetical protein
MKSFKNILFAGIIGCSMAALLSSCSNDDYLGGHSVTDGAGNILSVASSNTTWAPGDSIGISASSASSDASVRNRLFIVQDDGKTLKCANGEELYIKGNVSILAYYRVSPNNESTFVGNDGDEPMLVLNTINQNSLVDYKLAKAEGINASNSHGISLNFQSGVLATLNFQIENDGSDKISEWKMSGLAQTAYISPYSFDILLDEYIDFAGSGTDITSFSRRVIPQTFGEKEVKVVLNGNKRTYPLYIPAMTIENDGEYNVTVRIADGKAQLEVGPKNSSSDWDKAGDINVTSQDAN